MVFNGDQAGERTYHGEEGLELQGSEATATQHHAKKHVFRLVSLDGSTYLFDARNDVSLPIETIATIVKTIP